MFRRTVKITAFALSAALLCAGVNMDVQAAQGISSVLPSGGINIALDNGTGLESLQDQAGYKNIQLESVVNAKQVDEAKAAAVAQAIAREKAQEEEMFKNLVIAQVNAYVNVRSLPSESGEIVGKLYNNSVGTLLARENGWYQIRSGNVTGYVKGEFCVTGEEAIALAREVGTRIASVTCDGLYVRQEPSTESKILGMVAFEDDLLVLEETDTWVKVDTEEGDGWVSREYVNLHTEFVQAESREEEEARLAKEAADRQKAREAARQAQAAQAQAAAPQGSSHGIDPSSVTISGDNEMGVAVANYAVQFVGYPYKWGGTSLTNGADCSGFVMSVYANFGVSLPHSSSADRKQGYAVDSLANALPGDLICYSGHVALYIGDGNIVHASTSKTGIIISRADHKKILAIRRIF
ncbi:MAG: SH3 domain-containing protein [Lachnospiraceae bacterium]|nr:SH3 domain-containing protein [Lachnospiraceae bacterium]